LEYTEILIFFAYNFLTIFILIDKSWN